MVTLITLMYWKTFAAIEMAVLSTLMAHTHLWIYSMSQLSDPVGCCHIAFE